MIKTNPSVDDILDYFFYRGECTITLINKNNKNPIIGIFTPGFERDQAGHIIAWNFSNKTDKVITKIQHDQIALIKNDIP